MNHRNDCRNFQNQLPDLILTPGARPSPAAVAHMRICPPCTEQYQSFMATFAVLDTWKAPEPSPYFDSKMQVRLREEQAAPPMGWFESLATRLRLNTGRSLRPALAGALALALIAGGGSFIGLRPAPVVAPPPPASAPLNHLHLHDRNAHPFQELDQLQQDENTPAQAPVAADAQPIS